MPKKEFLMLAKKYRPDKDNIAGWMMSEKLDGIRAYWDGGVNRGIPASEVRYANTAKDGRLKIPPIATGLWTRGAKVIRAPEWFLDVLPKGVTLDGELWMGYGLFQKTSSTVLTHTPDDRWCNVVFNIFDSPSNGLSQLYASTSFYRPPVNRQETIRIVQQTRLPVKKDLIKSVITAGLRNVLAKSGEGLVFRNPKVDWEPHRSSAILKLKPFLDDEGTVVGYVSGRKTDKGGKFVGMLGKLIVKWNGKEFGLSGFTDIERKLIRNDIPATKNTERLLIAYEYAKRYEGEKLPRHIEAKYFPLGSKVTFRYRELSDDGIPKEARYLRKRID